MWDLGTWVSGGLGSAGGTVGFDGLRGLFQPQLFCDSTGYISLLDWGLKAEFITCPISTTVTDQLCQGRVSDAVSVTHQSICQGRGSELLMVELAEGGAGPAGSLGVTSVTGQAPCATPGSA